MTDKIKREARARAATGESCTRTGAPPPSGLPRRAGLLVRAPDMTESEEEWQRRKPSAWAPARFRDPHPLGTTYPPEESFSADYHDQLVVRAWDGTPIGVDAGMAPLLRELWRLGYRTYVSCQGDAGRWSNEGWEGWWAYIDFETSVMADEFAADFGSTGLRLECSCVRFPPRIIATLAAQARRRRRARPPEGRTAALAPARRGRPDR
jgi:hypothetical protein